DLRQLRTRLDQDARRVAERAAAARVGTDPVAGDERPVRPLAVDLDPVLRVPGDHVPGARRRAADRRPGRAVLDDQTGAVAEPSAAVRGGADVVAGDGVLRRP